MRAHHREILPFACPACGVRGPVAYREAGARLIERLSPVYVCKACGRRARPHRYWVPLVLAAGLVFPCAVFVVMRVTVLAGLGVNASVWLTAGVSALVAILAFQVCARLFVTWRPVR